MFEIGAYVVYGSQGVCCIADIRQEDLTGETKNYYVLSPVDDPKTVIYVPVDSAVLTAQMRALLSPDELISLIRDGHNDDTLEWINDSRMRGEMFRNILQSGDRRMIFRMLRTIYERREAQMACGRKLYAADEQAFERAEKLLHGEIAAILRIRPDQVRDYIASQLAVGG